MLWSHNISRHPFTPLKTCFFLVRVVSCSSSSLEKIYALLKLTKASQEMTPCALTEDIYSISWLERREEGGVVSCQVFHSSLWRATSQYSGWGGEILVDLLIFENLFLWLRLLCFPSHCEALLLESLLWRSWWSMNPLFHPCCGFYMLMVSPKAVKSNRKGKKHSRHHVTH